ncbi:melanopsin-like [Actinia tenebrosa]|uniref:Melanopsin-like n=1 Tax=Actinia tenebrosa TaxID=6105 RepID=A0A6P8HH78_ACTTE|nr:melanopsin-like [Actinia tenebrosa]
MSVPFSDQGYLVYEIMVILMLLIGVPSQMVAFFVFTRKKFRQMTLNKLFLNIVIANLIMIFCEFPLIMVSAFYKKWLFGRVGCIATGAQVTVTSITMIITLVCIEAKVMFYINMSEAHPLSKLLGPLKENALVVLIWTYAGICTVPTVSGWSEITLEPGEINCAPNWTAQAPKDVAYLALLTIFAYVLPVSVQIRSFWKLWKRSNQQLESISSAAVFLRNRAMYRSKGRMVMASTITFTLLWLPYCICSLITLSGKAYLVENDAAIIPTLVAKCSCIFSPIVYAVTSRRFRREFQSVLFCELTSTTNQGRPTLPRRDDVVIVTKF